MTQHSDGLVFVISDMAGGGAQQVVSRIMNAWAEQGRALALITLAGPESDAYPLHPAIQRIVLGKIEVTHSLFQKIRNNFMRVYLLRRALKKLKYKTAIGFIAPSNIQLIVAGFALNYRIIISERNDPARQSFGLIWDFLRTHLYKKADLVTANSYGALKSLAAFVPEHKLFFLPNPLRADIEHRQNFSDHRDPVFLNIGRLHKQKGQDLLIKAFAQIKKDLPGWILQIAGEGGERPHLEKLISSLNLEGSVQLLGHQEAPLPLYQKASLFVFPSRHEGTPNALMEAMACGLPVIASTYIPDWQTLIQHNETGLGVDPEKIEDLAAAMKQLAQSEEMRHRLGRIAHQKAEQFKLEHVIRHWNAIIELPTENKL